MSSQDFLNKLAKLRASSCAELPTPQLAILTRTISRLRRAGISQNCLQVGETVPNFEFVQRDEGAQAKTTSFYSVLEYGPAVVNFFRGFWCQYCKTELEAYESIQAELANNRCAYFAVSPQKAESAASDHSRYQLIYDRDNELARRYGIVYSLNEDEKKLFSSWGLDLEAENGVDAWQLPLAATFVILQNRTIGYAFVDVDFRSRCCPAQLVEEVRRCTGLS